MSYNKKQFAEKMISEIKSMHEKGFVYQSVGSLANLNNYCRIHIGHSLFKNKDINTLLELWHVYNSPAGKFWLNEDKKSHLKIIKKRLNICPLKLIFEAEKNIKKFKVKNDSVYLKTRK